jgi:pertussis toxin subunit 1
MAFDAGGTGAVRRLLWSGGLLCWLSAWADDLPLDLMLDPRPSVPPNIVYRMDTRGPDEVFEQGFVSRGDDGNLIAHLLGAGHYTGRSGFVSTSASEAFVRELAAGRLYSAAVPRAPGDVEPRVWIYTIRASGSLFSVERSLRYAVHRLDDCERSPRMQSRLNVLDHLLSQTLREQEWVAYRRIPGSLIHHATPYRYAPHGALEAVMHGRRDNPRFRAGASHGNPAPWHIPEMVDPSRVYLYRIRLPAERLLNQLRASAAALRDTRTQHYAGAQWCLSAGSVEDDTEAEAALRRLPRAVITEPELDQQTQTVVAQLDARLRALPRCEGPRSVMLGGGLPIDGDGSCRAPEAVLLTQLPNGAIWKDGALWWARVPWHTENRVRHGGGHRASYPSHCWFDAGDRQIDVLQAGCRANPDFSEFTLYLLAQVAGQSIVAAFPGSSNAAELQIDSSMLRSRLGKPLRTLLPDGGANNLIRQLFSEPDIQTRLYIAPQWPLPVEDGTVVPMWRWDDELR